MKKIALALTAFVLTACASYEKDLATMCSSPNAIEPTDDPVVRAERISLYVEENVKSREGRQLFKGLAAADAKAKREIVSAEAKKAGIDPCPIVELWVDAPEQSYAEDLQAICSANDFSAIESIAAVTDSGRNLVRTLAGMGESARVEVLHREVTQHRVMPCDVIDTK